MLGFGAQIAIGLGATTIATTLTTVGNIFLSNGIQQGMMEQQQKKIQQQSVKPPVQNNHVPKK